MTTRGRPSRALARASTPIMAPALRVAVVGAGSAGLAAAQQCRAVARAYNKSIELVVFERRSGVGGLWQYESDPGACDVRVPSSSSVRGAAGYAIRPTDALCPSAMYEDLRTNIPSVSLSSADLAGHAIPRYAVPARYRPVSHSRCVVSTHSAEVLAYLERFANTEDLLPLIHFETDVVQAQKSGRHWHLTTRQLCPPYTTRTWEVDCIVAAQGRCNVPNIPVIPGLHHFPGRQMHSAWYRYPDDLHARRILIVGNNSSGADIARELCGGAVRTWTSTGAAPADCVYQSYADVDQAPPMDYDPRDPASPAWCHKIKVVGPIDHVEADGTIVLQGGERLADIDLIVWATGFLYQVPFLSLPEAPLVVRDAHTRTAPDVHAASVLHHLDDWMLFYKEDATLCFLGLPNRIVPFPLTQLQARYVPHG